MVVIDVSGCTAPFGRTGFKADAIQRELARFLAVFVCVPALFSLD
jgi:hypothetical protein